MTTRLDLRQRLAPNFTLAEFVRTNHRSLYEANAAEALGYLEPLRETAAMLQLIRNRFGRPVILHSGFRGEALNTAIGGSSTSQHRKGEAADFHVHGVGLYEVFAWVRDESGLPYGQLILEGSIPDQPTWLHLSLGEPWRALDRCRQAMTWDRVNGYQWARRVHDGGHDA